MMTMMLWMSLLWAQPREIVFQKQKLSFKNGLTLTVEIAQSDEQRTRGLMYRQSLPVGAGMLFIFPEEQYLSFWMSNTLIPLSIGYFDKKRVLLEIHDMEPSVGPVRDENLPRYPSSRPAMYALEVQKGWFAKNKIKPGAVFTLQK